MPPPAEGIAARLIVGPTLRAQPDKRLVTLVRGGYEAAFEEIVRRYGKPLTRYASAIVGSRSEDVTQDAFSRALLAIRRDDAEIELRPWLYRIVRNTALNDLRDSPPAAEVLAEAIASGRGTAEEAEQREELTELIERLRALPEPQRTAIVMRELEGLSHDEIAAALGLSGGAARQTIYRARQALRNGLGLLMPLPLLRLLIEHGDVATAGVGAGAGGALAAGGAAGGAGTAFKAGAVAVVLAGSVGTGIAVQSNHDRNGQANAATSAIETAGGTDSARTPPQPSSSASAVGSTSNEGRGEGGGHGRARGDDGGGDDRGRDSDGDGARDDRGDARDDDFSSGPGRGRERDDDGHHGSGGPGPGGFDEDRDLEDDDHSGPGLHDGGGERTSSVSGSSGPGGGPGGDDDHSGPGGGGSSGSHSGSGSDSPPPPPPPPDELDDGDSSGSGSGSGSGGDSSSGDSDDLDDGDDS